MNKRRLGRSGLEVSALAWLLAQKPWIVPIPGSRNLDHLQDNLEALSVELTSDDLREIDRALSGITIVGDRCPKDSRQRTNR